MINETYDLVVVGGGPAGLTAAIYAARMGMKMILLESSIPGGRTLWAPIVENYPGFPEEVTGTDLIDKMVTQAKKFGARLKFPEDVLDLEIKGEWRIVKTRSGYYRTRNIIIATGAQSRRLLVPGEAEFLGLGVSYCAVCDGPLYKDKMVAVIGHSDEAFEDALYLSTLAMKVVLATHQLQVEASKTLLYACEARSNIEIQRAKVQSIQGGKTISSITLTNFLENTSSQITVDGVFISLGGTPVTTLAKKVGVDVDERGCIRVDRMQATNVEGVYAAGDCTCGGMQIVTATGEGARAAIQVYKNLNNPSR